MLGEPDDGEPDEGEPELGEPDEGDPDDGKLTEEYKSMSGSGVSVLPLSFPFELSSVGLVVIELIEPPVVEIVIVLVEAVLEELESDVLDESKLIFKMMTASAVRPVESETTICTG